MPIVDTYTLFGSWPAGGADISLEQLQRSLSGKDVSVAVAHTTDSVFEATDEMLANLKTRISAAPGLVPAAVINPSLQIKPWDFAAKIASDNYACARFFPELHGWPLGDYLPFVKCLDALAPSGMPVTVSISRPGQITALAAIEIARRIPIVLVHLHQTCVSEAAAVLAGIESWNVSTDGMTHMGLLEEMVNVIGSERIVFGSTAPRGSFEGAYRYVAQSSLGDKLKEAILSANARRIFGGRLGAN